MSDTPDARLVRCGTHGEVLPAYVCCHLRLNSEQPLGFVEPEFDDDDEDNDAQAWCRACDAVLEREGEWSDAAIAIANVKMVCEFCFAKLREIHYHPVSSLYRR
jgi:hypothetical protein